VFTRSEMVGREVELAALGEWLTESLSGRPRVVVCWGEPGIGKTRLAEEALAVAAARGAVGVWGVADESSGAPPCWPWWQALRTVAETVDVIAIAQEYRLTGDLACLAPDVFPSQKASRHGGASPEDRFRQFDAVARLLRRVCLEQPSVIVIHDAHWADEASLLLLNHVARGLTDERLLVVVNSRDSVEPPRSELLTRLAREPFAKANHLHGLPRRAVRQQLELMMGHDVDDADVAEVEELTAGNPFYVGEVGWAMAERLAGRRGDPVTPGVLGATAARLERLSLECIRVARAAAVVGREFSVPVVASMVELPALRCLAALDEAERARLIEVGGAPDDYRFTHALGRDAIEAGLGTPERVRLHRLAADAIEQRYASRLGPHLFELARHWAEAAGQGEGATAAGWIERAAEEAMRRLAYEEAARLFRQALRVGGSDLSDEDRCRLLLAAASAMTLYADLGGRLDACLQVAEVARRLGRPELVAEAALVMEPVGHTGFEIATRRLCDEALAGLSADSLALRSRVAARFAETFIYSADTSAALQASEQALELAEQCGDPRALAAALRARQVVRAGPDGLEERAALADRMMAVSRETGDPNHELSARLWQIDVSLERGDLPRVGGEIEALASTAETVGGPVVRFLLLHTRATLAQAQARFADACRLVKEAFTAMTLTDHPARFHVTAAVLGNVGRHIGHDAPSLTASGFADAPEEITQSAGLIAAIANAQALVSAGRLEDAAGIYRSLGPVAGWRPPPHVVLLSYTFGIVVAVGLEASADVALMSELLAPYRGHHVVSGIGALAYFGPVELWLGTAAHHLGRLGDAITDLEQADRACAASGAIGFRVEAQYELAAALASRAGPGDVRRARVLLADAAKHATALGMAPIGNKITALAVELDDAAAVPLTRRELEVAELLADGLTNREIAARLFLSERTAQNHVQHILTKLVCHER